MINIFWLGNVFLIPASEPQVGDNFILNLQFNKGSVKKTEMMVIHKNNQFLSQNANGSKTVVSLAKIIVEYKLDHYFVVINLR